MEHSRSFSRSWWIFTKDKFLLFYMPLAIFVLCSMWASNYYSGSLERPNESVQWAILVAGSRGWKDYRHQADVCAAYHVLKRGGLKDENIIIFMFDDIAYNTQNPQRGTIISNPGGDDVYLGVPKDYTGKHAHARNFASVLLGKREAITGGSGKVIHSKPDDYIFLFYSGHGEDKGFAFPVGPILQHFYFSGLLVQKNASGGYSGLLIFIEACYSGLFLSYIPKELNVYAVTAANHSETSQGKYCPMMMRSSPYNYKACLTNWLSDSWMTISDRYDRRTVTLCQVYEQAKGEIGSHTVMQGGKDEMGLLPLSTFLGTTKNRKRFKATQPNRERNMFKPIILWPEEDDFEGLQRQTEKELGVRREDIDE